MTVLDSRAMINRHVKNKKKQYTTVLAKKNVLAEIVSTFFYRLLFSCTYLEKLYYSERANIPIPSPSKNSSDLLSDFQNDHMT